MRNGKTVSSDLLKMSVYYGITVSIDYLEFRDDWVVTVENLLPQLRNCFREAAASELLVFLAIRLFADNT